MDEKLMHSSSFKLDQEILDARGINMTVAEVAGLPTIRYSEKVQALKLGPPDLIFLKCLRRRIKNRLASQNSRRRSVEHLRRLAKELLTVRACKGDAQQERANLLMRRRCLMERCRKLHTYIVTKLRDRGDATELPTPWMPPLDFLQHDDIPVPNIESTKPIGAKIPFITENVDSKEVEFSHQNVFECRLEKLVQKSVSHLLRNEEEPKLVCAKTIFISEQNQRVDMKNVSLIKQYGDSSDAILNLSLKNDNGRRKSHGRKQTAPRRIAYMCNESEDYVLDLKIHRDDQ